MTRSFFFSFFSYLVTLSLHTNTETQVQCIIPYYKFHGSITLLRDVIIMVGSELRTPWMGLVWAIPFYWPFLHQLRMGLARGSRSPAARLRRLHLNLDYFLIFCFLFLMRWVAFATHRGTILFCINKQGQRIWTEIISSFLPISCPCQ